MGKPVGPYVWVLEGFRDDEYHRWPCDGLEDAVVAEYLGCVPEGLDDVAEPFFDYLKARYGFEASFAYYDDVLIGTEQAP